MYIARSDPDAADRLIDRIEEICEGLAAFPYLGRARSDLAANLRSFIHRSYVIFYRPLPDGIELVRVLHGARDLAALFAED